MLGTILALSASMVSAQDAREIMQKYGNFSVEKSHGVLLEYARNTPDETGVLTSLAQRAYLDAGRMDLAVKLKIRSVSNRIGSCSLPDDAKKINDPLGQVISNAAASKVLAFNESHTSLEQRLFLYQNLDELWGAGYRHIGYEAFSWDYDFNLPLDQKEEAQGYIAEPVMAATIRKAQQLGFKLFAYESQGKAPETDDWKAKTDFRETEQARNVAAYSAGIPENEKIVLWAGWQHISKKWDVNDMFAEAWMAARLETTHDISVYSVDLTECNYSSNNPFSNVLAYKDGDKWNIDHDRYLVNAQFRLPAVTGGKMLPGEYRRALGHEVYISDAIRQKAEIMLVQAFKPDQAESGVPYDSVLMFDGENLPLYLPKGSFKLLYYGADGSVLGKEIIQVQ